MQFSHQKENSPNTKHSSQRVHPPSAHTVFAFLFGYPQVSLLRILHGVDAFLPNPGGSEQQSTRYIRWNRPLVLWYTSAFINQSDTSDFELSSCIYCIVHQIKLILFKKHFSHGEVVAQSHEAYNETLKRPPPLPSPHNSYMNEHNSYMNELCDV